MAATFDAGATPAAGAGVEDAGVEDAGVEDAGVVAIALALVDEAVGTDSRVAVLVV
jgi:hypothetical protein